MQCTMGNCCGRRAQLLAPADEEEDEFFAVPNPRGPRYRGQGRPLGKDGNPALRSRLGSASDGRRHHAAVANGCSFAEHREGIATAAREWPINVAGARAMAWHTHFHVCRCISTVAISGGCRCAECRGVSLLRVSGQLTPIGAAGTRAIAWRTHLHICM
jgi:hypothetical protein